MIFILNQQVITDTLKLSLVLIPVGSLAIGLRLKLILHIITHLSVMKKKLHHLRVRQLLISGQKLMLMFHGIILSYALILIFSIHIILILVLHLVMSSLLKEKIRFAF